MTEVAEQENDPQVGNTTEEDDDDSAKEKETFQWNTPADEFAEDVASDVEEESEDEAVADANRDNSTGEIIELSHQSEIINGQIGLGEPEEKPKKAKPKHQFPCPKCNKIWNWPWELRRHLVMHFKEVRTKYIDTCLDTHFFLLTYYINIHLNFILFIHYDNLSIFHNLLT